MVLMCGPFGPAHPRFRVSRVFPRVAWLALSGFIVLATPAAAFGQTAGTPLVDFIAGLREQGLTIIYSTELVTPGLRILEEPTAPDPVGELRQVLAPHGLGIEPGPGGSWLVVRAPGPRPVAPTGPRVTATPGPHELAPPALETVVVSASRYAFERSTGTSTQHVDRVQLENAPTLGEDALRAVHGLPGLTSNGLTARVNVRGGESNEALLLLDGVRLYSPYHLKDFQSLFGSISPRIIDAIDVSTGGYPAEFGDRMSAVIEMRSIVPEDDRHFEVGVSTLTSSALSSGRFADGKGAWLTSLRRGNLDLLIDAAGSNLGHPRYADFFNKLSYSFGDGVTLSSGALALDDQITLASGASEARAAYDDNYLWLTLEQELSPRLDGRYLLSRTRLHSERDGTIDDPELSIGQLADSRRYRMYLLRGDWSLGIGDRQLLKWGVELSAANATYRLRSTRTLPRPIRVDELDQPPDSASADLSLADRRRAVYASYRVQPLSRFTAELGLRWDGQSYLDEHQLSPRVSGLIDLGSRVTLRASWGRFYQAHGIQELQIGDGQTELFPAQKSEHTVLSLEYLLGDSVTLRAEIYRKEFERLRPRFENLFTRVSLLPELLPDRVELGPRGGFARGLELSAGGGHGPWQWWASWTRSEVQDRLAGRSAPRSWQEPWSFKGGTVRTGARWTVSGALTVRSGWPVTSIELVGNELVAGPYNASSFESFRSVDLRASRRFELDRSSLELFVELNNALNHKNPCCFDYELEDDQATAQQELVLETNYWLPTIPSVGFLWEF